MSVNHLSDHMMNCEKGHRFASLVPVCATISGVMTTNTDSKQTIQTSSPAETEAFGERLGSLLQSGDVLCLSGVLGAGKTALTRGLARGWGALERPTSPTFTLINEYHREADAQRFYHVDCYRLSGPLDAVTTGIEDIFDAPGAVVLEWPERIEEILPPRRLWIDIGVDSDNERTFTLRAEGERAADLLRAVTEA